MCSQYWPSKGSEDYGPFTVTLISETNHPSYIVRELSVHVCLFVCPTSFVSILIIHFSITAC